MYMEDGLIHSDFIYLIFYFYTAEQLKFKTLA